MTSFEVDKALDRGRATTSSCHPCPAWLTECATAIINGSLQESRVPLALKETLIRPIRMKLNLAVDNIGNYRPVANVSFLSKVVERVVADELQALLDDTNALDLFQLGSRLRHGMEMVLVSLLDDLLREADRGKMSLLVLLDSCFSHC